jgi:hypothetical protein
LTFFGKKNVMIDDMKMLNLMAVEDGGGILVEDCFSLRKKNLSVKINFYTF